MRRKEQTDQAPKRKVSRAGCKAKGTKAESEFCAIMAELGIPTQRVVASGSHKFSGAESDTKIGIIPNHDGTYPPADETAGIMRGEVKNHATTPERYFTDLTDQDLSIVMATKPAQEQVWKHLNQSKSNRAVILRRPKIPQGAITNKRYREMFGVFLDVEVFADLLRRAYPDRVFYHPEFNANELQVKPKSRPKSTRKPRKSNNPENV